jgi:hypothetical protein
MDKNIEELEDELETVCLRFNNLQADIAVKIAEGDNLYKRKMYLIEKLDRLKDE